MKHLLFLNTCILMRLFSGWVCGVSSLTACEQDKFCYTILDEKTAISNNEHKYIHTYFI